MDAYTATAKTDVLGRRSGPRLRRSMDQKRQIVEEAMQPGASVALVARRHDLNANVLFLWRRKYLKGELGALSPAPDLIPVKLVGSESESTSAVTRKCRSGTEDTLELTTSSGVQLRISGALARTALHEIIAQVLPR
jgi:transposase